jgi:lipid II:glycine glycyltransferase (peptidoglycan interpeptide bridge formation enzyme)
MIIVASDSVSRDSWQKYVESHQFGSIFHTPYLFDVYNSAPGFSPFAFFAVDRKGEIHGMLAGFLQTVKPGLLKKISTRSVMLQSPIYSDTEALSLLLLHYKQWSRGKAVYTEVRNHFVDNAYSSEFIRAGFVWEGHYNIVREMPESVEQLWKEVGRKRKDGINKAKRFNFQVCEDKSTQTVEDFYKLLSENYKTLGLPIPKPVFFHTCITADSHDNCKLFKLVDEGITRIVLLSFLFRGTLYAVYIGSDQQNEFLNKRPIDIFYYEVMRWCIENGVQYFDWLGAGKPNVSYGVRDFKLQYGGEIVDFGRFQYIHSPILYKLANTGFSILRRIKKKKQ